MNIKTLTIRLAVTAAIFSGSVQAYEPTGEISIGNMQPGLSLETVTCHDDRVLIGVELRYGSNGIGRIRGHCREWRPSGDAGIGEWSGFGIMTDWSSLHGGSDPQTDHHVSSYCPAKHAISGIKAVVGGAYIKELQLVCYPLNDAGGLLLAEGLKVRPPSVGPGSSTPEDGQDCPSGMAAQGFSTRTTHKLQSLRLECGTALTTTDYDHAYEVESDEMFDVYQWGRARGLGMDCKVLPGSTRNASCRFDWDSEPGYGVMLIGTPAAMVVGTVVARAEFNIFFDATSQATTGDHADLADGWRIHEIEIEPLTGPNEPIQCKDVDTQMPVDGTPHVKVIFTCENTRTIPVEFAYIIKKIVLIGPDGNQWEDAFDPDVD